MNGMESRATAPAHPSTEFRMSGWERTRHPFIRAAAPIPFILNSVEGWAGWEKTDGATKQS